MKVYKALQLSLLTYAAPAWQPWAAPSRIEQLERCQNKAMRVVTGQLKSTPVETLRREAGICNMAAAAKRTTALAYEKAHWLPPYHPRRQILTAPTRHRLKRQSWRFTAQVSANQFKSTLVETLRRVADIYSIATAAKSPTALAYEKARQLPPNQPRRHLGCAFPPPALKIKLAICCTSCKQPFTSGTDQHCSY